ncbi:MAG: 8-amino-7-oxononanoate synthase [Elusimicrobia bacterium GWC2_51_8]|nr:MAG: 8-amino-7-oxononanoate synthase [Elusimicrobia bacterium GWA2_51_34]OGR61696.1 MAG: 8-amino-7-oxononanoate synthase [Elusimicrobia bacterium GWC2_51_8]OGR87702.1 MAG: 8-amino-7-oxononanoate synthase [Elusimicrobia bacterium GWF2_52_66]
MDLFEKCHNFTIVKELIKAGIYPYFKELSSEQAPEVEIEGKKFIMFGSNNYLGLANDPRMKQAAIDAVKKFGTGVAGSRFLNGNTVLHTELERRLAAFKGRKAALIYSTGYQMNLGVVSALVGKGDVAVVDKLDHASIFDGCKLSNGEIRRFRHNNVQDLERVLKEIGPKRGKLVIVDGVFSMEGDIAPIPEIAKICKTYGARFMVDDAHATGVLGKTGRGTCEHFGLNHGEVDLVVGTCSKSFASIGGFVVGDKDILHYIQHISRSMMFSAALPPASVASIIKAIDIIETEPERIKRLWDNSKYLLESFKAMGFNTGETKTPIIPVIIGDNLRTFTLWKDLYEHGLFTNPVVSPAVPPKRSLIRVAVTATHTRAHLDRALNIFEDCTKKILKRKSSILVR